MQLYFQIDIVIRTQSSLVGYIVPIMSQKQPRGGSTIPTLQQLAKTRYITRNLFETLVSQEPPYTTRLLMLMSVNDIKKLMVDHQHLRKPEILQLIDVLSNLPQSQVSMELSGQVRNPRMSGRGGRGGRGRGRGGGAEGYGRSARRDPEVEAARARARAAAQAAARAEAEAEAKEQAQAQEQERMLQFKQRWFKKINKNMNAMQSKMDTIQNDIKLKRQQHIDNEKRIDIAYDKLIDIINNNRKLLIQDIQYMANENEALFNRHKNYLNKMYETTLGVKQDFEEFMQFHLGDDGDDGNRTYDVSGRRGKTDLDSRNSREEYSVMLKRLKDNDSQIESILYNMQMEIKQHNNDYVIRASNPKIVQQMVYGLVKISAIDANEANDVSSFKFIPHNCCQNQIKISEDGKICDKLSHGAQYVLYGGPIGAGRSVFRVFFGHIKKEKNDEIHTGIGFVPVSFNQSLDNQIITGKEQLMWYVANYGIYVKKGIPENYSQEDDRKTNDKKKLMPIRWSAGDTLKIVTQVVGNKHDSKCYVQIINETQFGVFNFVISYGPLRLIFYFQDQETFAHVLS